MLFDSCTTGFRSLPGESPDDDVTVHEQDSALESEEEEPAILCAFCSNPVTRPRLETAVQGGTRHTFANPQGLVFDIACFRDATGCRVSAESSTEFTWFTGYCWHFAWCNACSNHLGWWFRSRRHAFFGLILDHLIIP